MTCSDFLALRGRQSRGKKKRLVEGRTRTRGILGTLPHGEELEQMDTPGKAMQHTWFYTKYYTSTWKL